MSLLRKLILWFRTINLGEVSVSNIKWHLRQESLKRGFQEGD